MAELEILRTRELPNQELDPIVEDLRARGHSVQTGEYLEKGIDDVIRAGLIFILYLTVDETAREFVRTAWRQVLDSVAGISERRGPTRFSFKFRTARWADERYREFSIQVRTHEPDAMKWIDRIVRRLAELGPSSVLRDLPKGTRQAHADRHIPTGEEMIVAYVGDHPYELDLNDWKWKRRGSGRRRDVRRGRGRGRSNQRA